MQPAIVTELFSADVRLAVVAEEHDDGVVREPVSFKLLEDQADLAVQFGRGVEILRHVFASDGMIRHPRRQLDLGWVRARRRFEGAMGFLEIDLREERLVGLEVAPAIGVERLARIGKVPVRLGRALPFDGLGHVPDIRGEVTRVARPICQHAHPLGQGEAIVAM